MLRATNNLPAINKKLQNPELNVVAANILADCNKFAREMSRTLINTSTFDVKGNQITLAWITPYAANVYYIGRPRTENNPRASLQWCEVAYASFGKDWAKMIANATAEAIESD